MSKKKPKDRSRNHEPQHPGSMPTAASNASEHARIEATIADTDKLTPPEALALPAPADIPAQLDHQQLKDAYTKAYKAERYFTARGIEAKEKVEAASLKEREWDEKLIVTRALEQRQLDELAKLTANETELTKRRADQEAELGRRTALLDARDKEVQAREREADAGFVARAEEARLQLDAELVERRKARWAIFDAEVEGERARFKALLDLDRQRVAEHEAVLEQRALAASIRDAQLTEQQAQVAKEKKRIACDLAEAEGEREKAQEALARATERGRTEARADLASVRRSLDGSEQRVRDLEATVRGFGTSDAASLVSENATLKAELAKVRGELSNRPTVDEAALLRAKSALCDSLEQELAMARARVGEVELRLSQHHIKTRELETQRDAVRSLEKQRELLQIAQRELEQTYHTTIKQVEGATAFPGLLELDRTCAAVPATPKLDCKLDELCVTAQAVMADPQYFGKDRARHYDIGTIRTFVAGLAASRLHVLQGMSGTGKTSLPIWFARAVLTGGAEASECVATIAVQSGWRDRHDLMGHFNTFEKRFYESEFLRALYRAQTPKHAGRPFFILLDELNLSHPEQYFADFLSALEQPEAGQSVGLMEGQMRGDPPKLLVDGRIRVPPNVWFIGTANQDETTKGIAPKTRDRSHIMDLATKHERLEGLAPSQPLLVSLEYLEGQFKKARNTRARAYNDAQEQLKKLAAPLASASLGISNRLERYLESFVPVYVACGGKWEDALDHAVATKVVYGIKDRYDLTPHALKTLHEALPPELWARSSAVIVDAQARR